MASDSARPFGSSGLGPGNGARWQVRDPERIGAGGMGEVFKARHVHLNTFRCIKVMKQELLADDVFRHALSARGPAGDADPSSEHRRRPRLLPRRGRQLHGHGVHRRHDAAPVGAAHGRFPLALAADVATQVLAGLDHIHRRGLLHRDISPDNVMLAVRRRRPPDRRRSSTSASPRTSNSAAADTTQAGVLIGNPKYMSPEQLGELADGEQLDGRADLYCLGVVLYEMLLGVPPFASETPQGYIIKHLTAAAAPLRGREAGAAWPDGMEAVIFRALEKDRRKRFTRRARFLGHAAEVPRRAGGIAHAHGRCEPRAIGAGDDGPADDPQRRGHADHGRDACRDVPPSAIGRRPQALDTIEAYTEYLTRHPHAPQTTEAKARLFELELIGEVANARTRAIARPWCASPRHIRPDRWSGTRCARPSRASRSRGSASTTRKRRFRTRGRSGAPPRGASSWRSTRRPRSASARSSCSRRRARSRARYRRTPRPDCATSSSSGRTAAIISRRRSASWR